MRVPTIHLNGTSARELVDQIETAMGALQTAITALGETAPNGRDYYPQGPTAIGEAGREHQARIDRLQGVRQELEALYAGIDEQVTARAAR